MLNGREIRSVWEPACGGGHMVEVIKEYGVRNLFATDVHDYGYGQVHDFLSGPRPNIQVDWIITNPPYGGKGANTAGLAEQFAIRALTHPGVIGVAMLCRLIWLEGGGRYERLFRRFPPSQVAIFCDRLGFQEGNCVVKQSGMIPYAWFIWDLADRKMNALTWIPAKTRDVLTKPDDQMRFGRRVMERT